MFSMNGQNGHNNPLLELVTSNAFSTVLLACDRDLVLMGLSSALRISGHYTVCRETSDITEVPKLAQELTPDVIVLSISSSLEDLKKTASMIHAVCPENRTLVVDFSWSLEVLESLTELGIYGVMLPPSPVSLLPMAIESVANKCLWVGPTTSTATAPTRTLAKPKQYKLQANEKFSQREKEVFDLIAQGLSNKEIAVFLSISRDTVKTHVHHILEKAGVHNRAQLILKSRNNLLEESRQQTTSHYWKP